MQRDMISQQAQYAHGTSSIWGVCPLNSNLGCSTCTHVCRESVKKPAEIAESTRTADIPTTAADTKKEPADFAGAIAKTDSPPVAVNTENSEHTIATPNHRAEDPPDSGTRA